MTNPAPRRARKVINTPLSKTASIPVRAYVVVELSNGSSVELRLDLVTCDMTYEQGITPVSWATGVPGAPTVRATISLRGTVRSESHTEPSIPEIPKFSSMEDAQAWLDKNTTTA